MSEINAELSADPGPDDFTGYADNPYQHTMHRLATASLWLIVVLGVATGVFGFFWGLAH